MSGRTLDIETRVELNNDVMMPILGLGVYLAGKGRGTENAVLSALEAGYRLIDTASMYGNEPEVGRAIKMSGIPREEIFVTTKLWNDDHGYDRTIKAAKESLSKLQMNYIDLYLIHWPVYGKRLETWKAFEALYEEGLFRAIGVSNYEIRHLEELLGSCQIKPAVNQVEFSPFTYRKELLEFSSKNGIVLEAYSPLARGAKFSNHVLLRIARKHGKSPAQVMIRWILEKGVVAIPKSSNRERIRENASVFDFSLDEEDTKLLDSLNEDYHVSWDPTGAP